MSPNLTNDPASLFRAYVDAVTDGEEPDFEALCEKHPSAAADLRARHREWRSIMGDLEAHHSEPEELEEDAWSALLEQLRARGPAWTRYEDQGEIARGGMGSVRLVYDRDARRKLAMKVMLHPEDCGITHPADKRRFLGRFLEEAQITAQLDHPGIVPVHEIGLSEDETAYFTMKLVRGRDLEQVFRLVQKGEKGWSVARALGVFQRVCEAVAYAHTKGVVHRDLKPANIMVGRFGETYVMDWGLARLVDDSGKRDATVEFAGDERKGTAPLLVGAEEEGIARPRTQEGAILGTPHYMPPEQAAGDLSAISPRTDVYALGAMLYQLLSGFRPYEEDGDDPSPGTVLGRIFEGPPTPLRELAPSLPDGLLAIVECAMEREPARRYSDTNSLSDALRGFLEGEASDSSDTQDEHASRLGRLARGLLRAPSN